MEKKSKIDIHDSESTSSSLGRGGGCVNNLCISLSEEEQTSDGRSRRRKVFVMPGENEGIEKYIL